MVNAKVHHKIFGTGIVEKINEGKISVLFNGKSHMFVYPDAFEKHLTADDTKVQKNALADFDTKKVIMPDKPLLQSPQKPSENIKRTTAKKPTHKNIIIKCNYCDGGATEKQVGYNGVCSDATIRYNVQQAKRPWCSNDRCPCAEYLNGKYSYKELSQFVQGTNYICYESVMLENWKTCMGWNSNGEKPMKLPEGARTNSLAILTTREPHASEAERIVFAVFLAGNHCEGDDAEEGWVFAHQNYRIKLSLDEARKILLWNYYANRNNPTNPKWGTKLHRMLDDDNAVALLADIAEVKRGTEDESLANELLTHFCALNSFDVRNLPKASGALRLASQ
jgi:hypothetical protein